LKNGNAGSYLFLQGPASLFFARLAHGLRARGHQVRRINFNGGDRVFWRGTGAIDYYGDEETWSPFLMKYLSEHQITDLVLLSDCRPLHRLAIKLAKANGITTHIFEEGYIRPNWITLENMGVNGASSLPKDIQGYFAASALPREMPAVVQVPVKLPGRAVDDVMYAIATILLAWRFRKYNRHWPYGQMAEYAYGAKRLFRHWFYAAGRKRAIAEMTCGTREYYVFPMQIDMDSQIRFHSRFRSQTEVVALVVASFALHAPADSELVITEHPLETSPINWRRVVREQARICGVSERVVFLDGGSPREMLQACSGIVVVNSTAAQQGLELRVPVIALGDAVFNLPGITYQNGIDRFWREARPAEPFLIEMFQRVLIAETQINGNFFTDKGIALAVANTIQRLEHTALRGDMKVALGLPDAADRNILARLRSTASGENVSPTPAR
jgi:capsular polysaccharide export protein